MKDNREDTDKIMLKWIASQQIKGAALEKQTHNRRWNDCLTDWRNFLLLLIAGATVLCGSAVFAWDKLARPDIRCEIKKETVPLQDSQEYTNYLLMAKMSDEEIQQATNRYIASKRARMGVRK
jgi:hypothetical protein